MWQICFCNLGLCGCMLFSLPGDFTDFDNIVDAFGICLLVNL